MILLFTIAGGNRVAALEIEKFLMPGEVISKHARYESECALCHVRMRDTTQKKLCLDCHEPVAVDIDDKLGFHGKNRDALAQDCKSCHGDHRGRDARIVWLDTDNFNHRETDFLLEGKHTATGCSACHGKQASYREASHDCYSCHSDADPHAGKLGKNCSQCHTADNWNKSGFDHDKTGFKLEFSHRNVTCNACHIEGKYAKTPKQCSGCHAIRDVHANRFGNQCQHCHRANSWRQTTFAHGRDTDFPLRGGHRNQSCNSCHAAGKTTATKGAQPRACYSCHRNDDVHNGSNGKACSDCHGAGGWQLATFDHDARTRFPLRGGHAELVCEACHVGGDDNRKLQSDCKSCHWQKDVHQGGLGENCTRCHNDGGWQQGIRFDHDLGNFPLLGQHAALACEACHASAVFTETQSGCIDCHRGDDIHDNRLGGNCARCHNPNDWLIWHFDHDLTTFGLRYSHLDIHCQACHDEPLDSFAAGSWRCVDCHRRDDVHEGRFGTRCGKCHNESKFSSPDIESLRTFRPGPDLKGGKSP